MKKGLPLCHILFIKPKENAGALEEKGQHMRKTKKKSGTHACSRNESARTRLKRLHSKHCCLQNNKTLTGFDLGGLLLGTQWCTKIKQADL